MGNQATAEWVTCSSGDEAPGSGTRSDARIAPNDLDAEGIILGHCIEHGPIAGLLGRHFYADANRYVYEALAAVVARGEPLDVVAVARELRANDRLQQVGGAAYLACLAQDQPATAYAENHAAAIRELYRRRVLIEAAERLRLELYGGLASGEAWQRMRRICEELSEA